MNRTLSLVSALLLTAGCFGSHGADDDPTDDPGPVDAGPLPADWGPHDSGPRGFDTGPVERDWGPAGPCSPRRADLSCGTAPYPSGVPFELPVAIGGEGECYCGETIDCAVSVLPGPDGEPEAIGVSTSLCVGGALCDACFPYIEGSCRVPALPGGSYPVLINGDPAFDLQVEEADFIGRQQCTRVADADPRGCGPVHWPAQDFEPSELCHPESIFTGTRATITVVDTCASCDQQPGPCTVTLDESGFAPVLQVETSRTFSMCDVDCPSICMRMEHECVVPDTLPGETSYQVIVDGVSFGTTIEVGSFAGGEICAGVAIGG